MHLAQQPPLPLAGAAYVQTAKYPSNQQHQSELNISEYRAIKKREMIRWTPIVLITTKLDMLVRAKAYHLAAKTEALERRPTRNIQALQD